MCFICNLSLGYAVMILHWYECAAVGKAKRATGASALFNAGVPERLIRDVTGHKLNALHLYERPTEQQKKNRFLQS